MKTKTEITPAIIRAIKKAAEQQGSQNELSRVSGVNQPTLNALVNGKNKSITKSTWEKLLPYVAPYLSIGDNAIVQTVKGHHNIGTINGTIHSDLIDKILASDLTAEEKVKFIEVVRK